MGRTRERRKGLIGFVGRWFRRFRRLAVLGGIGAAVYAWWQGRSGGSSGRGGAGFGDEGGGGSGRRAPIGGPLTPSPLRATATPEREPEPVNAVAGTEASTGGGGSTDTAETDDNGGPLATVHPLASVPHADEQAQEGATVTTTELTWVEPVEGGTCPSSHPVKANDNSGIYHVPGGRFYERTEPERCYVSAAAAEADGYRPAKA